MNALALRRCFQLCALAAFFLLSLGAARADFDADLNEAARPLRDGVPQVAVARLQELSRRDGLATEQRRTIALRLGEALIAAEQPRQALKILADPVVADLPDAKFLQAQADAALGDWPAALDLYQQLAKAPGVRFREEALLGTAEALRALGRVDEALQALESLRRDEDWAAPAGLRQAELLLEKQDLAGAARKLDAVQPKTAADRKQRRFLRACLSLHQNDTKRAIKSFASIIHSPEGAASPVMVATLIGIADAHLRAKSPDRGDDFLEDFVEHHPTDPELPRIFAKLDELYAAERRQSRHELGRWSNEDGQPRRALATWYLARAELRLGHRDVALEAFRQLRANHPPLPALAAAFLEEAELRLADGRSDEALAATEAARALHPPPAVAERVSFAAGRAQFAAGQFNDAATIFQQIATSAPQGSRDANYDASIAWLAAGDLQRANATALQLNATPGAEPERAELMLERGLLEASKRDPHAAESLQNFLRDFPKHERAAEAWIALAELAFHAAPPRIDEARKDLAHATESNPAPAAAERADYLAIWIEDAARPDDAAVIALATGFLQKYASSARLPEVRLKLAETYFRQQNFASAQTQFEILAQQNPGSPEAENAEFFAARSAMQSMGTGSPERALVLFDDVVKRNGALKWRARNEQAVIERKLGKPQDAITLYDEVMRGDAQPAEKREALCGKADILYELGVADRENYRRAIALYDQLATQKDAPPHWRHQALFKKGMCLEKLDAPADALAAFYRIVEDDMRADRPREYFWFYKAGFNAARLLEQDSKWQPAAAVYEKLAFAGGARSEEAKSRLDRLRLEHFLWEQ